MTASARVLVVMTFALSGMTPVGAQGTVRGQIVGAPSRVPIGAAWVTVLRDGRRVAADSLGHYAVPALAFATHRLVFGATGFRPETTEVDLDVDMLELSPVALQPAVRRLEERVVTATGEKLSARISGFEERRKFGNGTFIDRTALERFASSQTSDALQALAPGISVRRGTSRRAWAATARAPFSSGGAFTKAGGFQLDNSDIAAGARPACYMDVYLDGALVYNSKASSSGPGTGIPLFDLNSISPEQIESVEVYSSASQVPAQFNRTSGGCGVLVIWLRG